MRRVLPLLLFAPLAAVSAATIDVTSAVGSGSLRSAIEQVNALGGGPHTIRYADAFPFQTAVLLGTALPPITATDVTIDGNGREPAVDGGDAYRILQIGPNTAKLTLVGLTLRNGRGDRGACIDSTNNRSVAASLVLQAVRIEGCTASGSNLIRGGGIHWNGSGGTPAGTVAISDSVFENNLAEATAAGGQSDGGALYTNASLVIADSRFESNGVQSTQGGGFGGAIRIYGSGAFVQIRDSSFRFNSASPTSPSFGYGGAIALICDACDLQLQRSYLRGNSANRGGGVYAGKSSAGAIDTYLTLSNVTLYNHSVLGQGGAVYAGPRVGTTLSNNTFYNNDAAAGAHVAFDPSAELYFFRANLLAPSFAGTACNSLPITTGTIGGGNLLSDGSCNALGGSSIPNTPLGNVIVDDQGSSVGVLRFTGSAVVDSLAQSQCEPRDARFQQRPIDGDGDGDARCDVGAYEFSPLLFKDSFE